VILASPLPASGVWVLSLHLKLINVNINGAKGSEFQQE